MAGWSGLDDAALAPLVAAGVRLRALVLGEGVRGVTDATLAPLLAHPGVAVVALPQSGHRQLIPPI